MRDGNRICSAPFSSVSNLVAKRLEWYALMRRAMSRRVALIADHVIASLAESSRARAVAVLNDLRLAVAAGVASLFEYTATGAYR